MSVNSKAASQDKEYQRKVATVEAFRANYISKIQQEIGSITSAAQSAAPEKAKEFQDQLKKYKDALKVAQNASVEALAPHAKVSFANPKNNNHSQDLVEDDNNKENRAKAYAESQKKRQKVAINGFIKYHPDAAKDPSQIWQRFIDFVKSRNQEAAQDFQKDRSSMEPLLQKAATEHAKNAAPEGPTEKDIQQVCDAVQSADLQNQPYTADPKHFLEMLATGQKELREAVAKHADILNNTEVAAAVAERHQSAIRQWNERDLGAAQREVAAALRSTGDDALNFDDFVDRHVRQQPSVQLLQQSRDDATLKTMWKGNLRQTVRAAYQQHMERALQSAARAAATSAQPRLAVMNATNYRAALVKTPQMQAVFAAAPKLRLQASPVADAEIAAGFEAFRQAELQRDYQSLRGVVAAGLGRAATSTPKSYEDFLQTALSGTQSLAKKWPTEELWSANGDALSKQCKQAYTAACTAAATNLVGTLPVPPNSLASQNDFIGQMLGKPQLSRFTADPRLAGVPQNLQGALASRYQAECQQMRQLGQQALLKMQKDAKPKEKETQHQLASRLLQEASSKGVLAAQANFLQTDGQMKQAASTVATALIEHRKQQQKEETQRQESQEQSSPLTPKVRNSAAKQVQAMLSKSPALTKAQALQQLFDQKEWQPFAKAMAADREFLASVDKVFASSPPAKTGKEYAADLVEAGAQDFWDARGKALEQHLLQLPPDQRQQAGAAFVRQSAPAAIAKAVMADKRFTQLLKAPIEAEAAPQAQSVAALRAQLLSKDSVQAVAGASRAECAAVVKAALGEGAKTMQLGLVRQLSQELFRAATAAQKQAQQAEKTNAPPPPKTPETSATLQQVQARLGKAIGAASAQKITSFLQDVQEKNGQLPPESQLLQALENAPKNARTPEELLAQLGLQNLKQSTAGSRAAMLGALQQLIDVQADQADQLSAAEAEQADAKTEEDEADDEKDKDADDEKGGVFNAPEMEKKKKGGGIGKFREGKGLGEAQNEDENEQADALPEEGDDKQAAAAEAEKQQVAANQIDDGQAGQKLAQLVEQAAAEHQPKISQEQGQNQPNALPQATLADSEETPLHLLTQQDSAAESATQPEQSHQAQATPEDTSALDIEKDPALQQSTDAEAEQQQNQPDSQAESMAEGQQTEELQQPTTEAAEQSQEQTAGQLPPEQAEADAPLPRQQAEQMTEQNQEQKDQQEQQEAKALEEQEQAENEQLLATAQAAAEAMEQEMQKTELSKEAMERVQALTMLVQTAEQEEDEERLLHLLAKQTPEDDALKKVLEKVAPKLTPAGFGMAALPFLLVYAGAHLRQGMPLWQLAEKVLDCLCILRGERNTTTTQALPAAMLQRPVRRPREVFFTLLGSASRAKWIDANKAHAKLALSSKRSGGIKLSISAPKHKPWKQTAPLALAGGGS